MKPVVISDCFIYFDHAPGVWVGFYTSRRIAAWLSNNLSSWLFERIFDEWEWIDPPPPMKGWAGPQSMSFIIFGQRVDPFVAT